MDLCGHLKVHTRSLLTAAYVLLRMSRCAGRMAVLIGLCYVGMQMLPERFAAKLVVSNLWWAREPPTRSGITDTAQELQKT